MDRAVYGVFLHLGLTFAAFQKQHASPLALTCWLTGWKLCMIRDKVGGRTWVCVCIRERVKESCLNGRRICFDWARSRLTEWNSEKEGLEENRLCSRTKFGVQWLLQSGLIAKKRTHTHTHWTTERDKGRYKRACSLLLCVCANKMPYGLELMQSNLFL